jgi:hypothetical protein
MKNKFDFLSKNGLMLMLLISFSALNAQYDFDWAKEYSRYDYNSIVNIGSDAADNYYVCGQVRDSLDVDFGTAVLDIIPTNQTSMFIAKYSSAGALIWAAQIGNNNAFIYPTSMKIDPNGNIYMTGLASTEPFVNIDFDPGPDTFNLASASTNTRFQWVLKLNTNGEFRWADDIQSINSSSLQSGALNVDNNGNVFISGSWDNTLDFGGPLNISLSSPIQKYSSFLAKYNSTGVLQWAKGFIYDAVTSVSLPRSGISEIFVQEDNIYLSAFFDGTLDFNPGAAVDTLTAPNNYGQHVLINLDTSANFNFAKLVSGTVRKTLLDATGNIYMSGSYFGTVDFDQSTAVVNQTSNGFNDAFVAKYDNNGMLSWVKSFGGADSETARSMTLDADNNLLITGYFRDTVDFNPGAGINQLSSAMDDCYLLKLNSTGDYVSAYSWGGTSDDYALGILVDNAGAVLIFGETYSMDMVYDQFRGSPPSKKYLMKLLPQTTALIENIKDAGFLIYPNPAKNQFTISQAAIGANVNIYDITGKLVISEIVNEEVMTITTEQLANGLYIVQLENEGQFSQMKLIIRK